MADKPDYRNTSKKDTIDKPFPVQMTGEYRVHITEDAYTKMKTHAGETNEVELCGVLIGDVARDSQGSFLLVSAIIEGKNANNAGAQVTFTHQTWEHINPIKDKEYPKQRIVGWYHTHPGFGIFLSQMDVFIQESYFNYPYMVAIVIETKQNQEGCFAWVDGKSTPLARYWVGNSEVKLTQGSASEIQNLHMPAAEQVANPALVSAHAAAVRDAYAEPPQRPIMSITMLLLMITLFLCGLLFGKVTAYQQFRSDTAMALENEVYSLLDFASVSTAAAKDLDDLNEKLTKAAAELQKGDTAAATKSFDGVRADLAEMQKTYAKRRSTFRNDIEQVVKTRQGLSERVEASMHNEEVLALNLASLYVMRAFDMLKRENGGPADLSKLTPNERDAVRGMLDKAIRLSPEIKMQIEMTAPKLLEALFSEPVPQPSSPSSQGEPPPAPPPAAPSDPKKP